MRAGFEYARRLGPERFFRKAFYNSPADLKMADNPAWMKNIIVGSRSIIQGGFEPSANDLLMSVSNWTYLLERSEHPVTCIHGKKDIYWDFAEIEKLLRPIPKIRLRPCENGGHLPLSWEPEALLELLDNRFPVPVSSPTATQSPERADNPEALNNCAAEIEVLK